MPIAMTVNKPGLYGVHTDESVTGVGVSPLSKRPAERDSGNGAVESVAGLYGLQCWHLIDYTVV